MVAFVKIQNRQGLALAVACCLLIGCGGSDDGESSGERAGPGPPAPAAEQEFDPTVPPSDDRVRQDLTSDGVLEIKLGREKGKKSWNSAHSQYFWEKYAEVKRAAHLSGVKDAKVIIKGWARYEITGGRYNYREFKVGSNEYEGIPSPSDEEAIAFIKSKLADFLRGPANSMVNAEKIEVTMAGPDEQKWVWHNANSVSFNVRVKYDRILSYTEVGSFDDLWEARIYRNDIHSPWHNVVGSQRRGQELQRKTYTAEQVRAMEVGVPQ